MAELKRLQVDIKGADLAKRRSADNEEDSSWRDKPARLHAIVPELPEDFRLTNDITMLTQIVLATGETRKRTVGFYGMGGIGKTVTGAAVCRTEAVRDFFDKICWVTLGQNPIIPKLQSLAHVQLTGSDLADSLTVAEKEDALRKAMEKDRILLVLDDLWNEDDEQHFNFLPPVDDFDNGSRVLISTRVRGLLKPERPGGVNAIEVGLPSVSEAVRIVMNAADMGGQNPPAEADQVVEICGRLPLALRLAGRLISSLAVAADWQGIPDLLKAELAGGESMSTEIAATITIRASVAAITGSPSEVANVKALFTCFGLIPEDTIAPLEVLLIIFQSVTGVKTTLLKIRKWIKILLDRCLILGHVDRPQLHDLVLDYCLTQFSPEKLRAAHTAVVNAFRAERTVSPLGIVAWDVSNSSHEVTRYCVSEIQHHIAGAIGDGPWQNVSSEGDGFESWLMDIPADCVNTATVKVLGCDAVCALAKAAADNADHWKAAVYLYGAGAGRAEEGYRGEAVDTWCRSLDQLDAYRREIARSRKTNVSHPVSPLMEEYMELKTAGRVVATGSFGNETVNNRLKRLVDCQVMDLDPEAGLMARFAIELMPAWFTSNFEACSTASVALTKLIVKQAESCPDPLLATRLKVCATMWVPMIFESILRLNTEEILALSTRDFLTSSTRLYVYEAHHQWFNNTFNQDFTVHAFTANPLLMFHGAVEDARMVVTHAMQLKRKCMEEGDPEVETSVAFVSTTIQAQYHLLLDPQRTEMAETWSQMQYDFEHSWNWKNSESTVKIIAEQWKGACRFSNAAADDFSGNALCDELQFLWVVKFLYLLISIDCSIVNKAEVLESMPLPDELIARCRTVATGCPCASWFGISPHVFGALAMESIGEDQLAMQWLTCALETPVAMGGDPKASSEILFRLIRARIFARRGLPGDDAKAAAEFEGTAAVAAKYSLRWLTAVALAQQQSFVPQLWTPAHATRLETVLETMYSSSESIRGILVGITGAKRRHAGFLT
eukprot:SAG31_NODE_1466_length_8227_cov_10.254675_2_plen_1008_part_00